MRQKLSLFLSLAFALLLFPMSVWSALCIIVILGSMHSVSGAES